MSVQPQPYRLDVHIDFCEVAIAEGGELRSAGRIETKPEKLKLHSHQTAFAVA